MEQFAHADPFCVVITGGFHETLDTCLFRHARLDLDRRQSRHSCTWGKSANAKDCQKGGWTTLAREDQEWVAFVSQDECVSYGAQGGTLTAYVPAPSSGASLSRVSLLSSFTAGTLPSTSWPVNVSP
jgi:hypothetical protein